MGVGTAVRRIAIHGGLMVGLLTGYFLCLEYTLFLMAEGAPFGAVDPVFGNEIKFYVFALPMLWGAWWLLFITALLALVSSVLCSYFGRSGPPPAIQVTRVGLLLGTVATRTTRRSPWTISFGQSATRIGPSSSTSATAGPRGSAAAAPSCAARAMAWR